MTIQNWNLRETLTYCFGAENLYELREFVTYTRNRSEKWDLRSYNPKGININVVDFEVDEAFTVILVLII